MVTLVIGYGNPLRGDDACGWYVAEHLSEHLGGDARAVACAELTPEMAHLLRGAGLVVFVEAGYGRAPGAVGCTRLYAEPLQSAADADEPPTPSQVLGLVRRLGGKAPPAYLLTVAGQSFGGKGLSAAARRGCEQALRRIKELVLQQGGVVLRSGGIPISEMYGYA